MEFKRISGFLRGNYAWLAFFLCALIIISPLGEFPLNDDWAYALSVRHLLEDRMLVIPDIVTATLVWQTVWGGMWALLLGPSFAALRISTLALALLAALCLGKITGEKKPSWLAPLSPEFLLLSSPFFLMLSFTFMTDVPYIAWMLLSALFYSRALENDSAKTWLCGAAAVSLAYLTRQIAVAVPAAILIALHMQGKLSVKRLLLAFALPVAVIAAHYYWFNIMYGGNWASRFYLSDGLTAFLITPGNYPEMACRAASTLLYCGLFSLPLAILLPRTPLSRRDGAMLAAALLLLGLFTYAKGLPPYYPNLMTAHGFGINLVGSKSGGILSNGIFWCLVLAASAYSLAKFQLNSKLFRTPQAVTLLLLAGTHLALSVTLKNFYDRYVLTVFVPFLAAAYVAVKSREDAASPWRLRTAAGASLLLALLAFAGTWDYMNWNRAKNNAAEQGTNAGLAPERINNGFDWYAALLYEPNMNRLKKELPLNRIGRFDWIKDNEFSAFVSFGRMDSPYWDLKGKTDYFSPLTLKRESVCLYELKNGRTYRVDSF